MSADAERYGFAVANGISGTLELALAFFAAYALWVGRHSRSRSPESAKSAINNGTGEGFSSTQTQDLRVASGVSEMAFSSNFNSNSQSRSKPTAAASAGENTGSSIRRQLHRPFHITAFVAMLARALFHFAQPFYMSDANRDREVYSYSMWVLLLFLGYFLFILAQLFLLVFCLLFYYELRDLQLSATARQLSTRIARLLLIGSFIVVVCIFSFVACLVVFWDDPSGTDFADLGGMAFSFVAQSGLAVGFAIFGGKVTLLWKRFGMRTFRLLAFFRRIVVVTAIVTGGLVLRAVFELVMGYLLLQRCWWTEEMRQKCSHNRNWILPWPVMVVFFVVLEWFPFAVMMWFMSKSARSKRTRRRSSGGESRPLLDT